MYDENMRKSYTSDFKVKAVLEIFKEEKSLSWRLSWKFTPISFQNGKKEVGRKRGQDRQAIRVRVED